MQSINNNWSWYSTNCCHKTEMWHRPNTYQTWGAIMRQDTKGWKWRILPFPVWLHWELARTHVPSLVDEDLDLNSWTPSVHSPRYQRSSEWQMKQVKASYRHWFFSSTHYENVQLLNWNETLNPKTQNPAENFLKRELANMQRVNHWITSQALKSTQTGTISNCTGSRN
jgi:hypothetical protein